ncbi:MAG: hypothetical protein HeimC3_03460 [Candidatus Heimdallarchaeota archaeon LC_3]|nr:MAG: hypothetical protein HeimC3_03460 [Candidatus Heimdallarchaeota archaeon LC_3]
MRMYNYNYCKPAFMPRYFQHGFSGTEQDDLTRIPKSYYEFDEENDLLNLTVELPGIKKEDIKISSSDKTLSLSTVVNEEDKTSPRYKRHFRFHHKIKGDSIIASYADGTLKLTIKKDVPKKYDVNVD